MTTDWDGQGLPPAALARMERGRSSAVRSSLLSVPGHVGVEACGFSVVGEVMGCIVESIGFTGWAGCGYGGYGAYGGGGMFGGGYGGPTTTVTSGRAGGWVGYAPYVDALYHGFDTALYRMLLECQSLGGDGVVGVGLTQTHLGQGNREFVALGTAVRAAGGQRPARLFSTTLNGQDFAKLVHGGWMPASVVIGISVAIRHDDWATRQQARAWQLQHRGLRLYRAREPRTSRFPHPARPTRKRHRRRRRDDEHDDARHPRPRGEREPQGPRRRVQADGRCRRALPPRGRRPDQESHDPAASEPARE